MKIKRIYLSDFGLFRNQEINHLTSGLVVIAGLNRSGKTLFMNALRYLGYGLPQKKDLVPPAVNKHEIIADVERNGHRYCISVLGNSNPIVQPLNQAPEATIEELYNHLDSFTYRQIFTISLDELRQAPENIDNEEKKKISAVLLGAGWSDALQLLKTKEKLEKKAIHIAGKHGSLNIKQLKEPRETWLKALKQREQANEQMDAYERKCSRLQELNTQLIPKLKQDLDDTVKESQRLELIKERFADYQEYKYSNRILTEDANQKLLFTYPPGGLQKAVQLQEKYKNALEQEQVAKETFCLQTGFDSATPLRSSLLELSEEMNRFAREISGWRVQVSDLLQKEADLEGRINQLNADLKELCGSRPQKEVLDQVNRVRAGQIKEQELQQTLRELYDLETEKRQKEKDLEDQGKLLEEKNNQLDRLPLVEQTLLRKVYILLGADVLAVVLLSLFFSTWIAAAAGFAGAVGILVYFLKQHHTEQVKYSQLAEIQKDIRSIEASREALKNRLESLNRELEIKRADLEELKRQANIPLEINTHFLLDYLRNTRQLQRTDNQIRRERQRLAQEKEKLSADLAPVLLILGRLGLLDSEHDDIFYNRQAIFEQLDRSISYLKLARELQETMDQREALENEILQLLAQEDPAVQEKFADEPLESLLAAFIIRGKKFEQLEQIRNENELLRQKIEAYLDSEQWRCLILGHVEKERMQEGDLLAAYGTWCDQFASTEEVQKLQDNTKERIEILQKELEQGKEEKRELEKEVHELQSDQKLQEAREQIEEAMQKLRALMEKYSEHNIASFMLDQVYNRLMEETRTKLIEPANQIFRKITGDSYDNITLPSNPAQPDFKVSFAGQDQGVNILSRGTREQLFFSIRLSRIREIKPELPVILDDSFSNFDPLHAREAVKYISELAQTHQVFVLTCHPQLLETIQAYGDNSSAQFWYLYQAKFHGPYQDHRQVCKMLIEPSSRQGY